LFEPIIINSASPCALVGELKDWQTFDLLFELLPVMADLFLYRVDRMLVFKFSLLADDELGV
jgi:hypothetical protein